MKKYFVESAFIGTGVVLVDGNICGYYIWDPLGDFSLEQAEKEDYSGTEDLHGPAGLATVIVGEIHDWRPNEYKKVIEF